MPSGHGAQSMKQPKPVQVLVPGRGAFQATARRLCISSELGLHAIAEYLL